MRGRALGTSVEPLLRQVRPLDEHPGHHQGAFRNVDSQGIVRELGIDTHVLLHMKEVTNKDLL